MMSKQLSLLDFGINENGEYVNLVEEEEIKNDISEKELNDFINNHHDPLIRLANDYFTGYQYDNNLLSEIADKLEQIVKTKCYHYGNMEKGLYIFSLYSKEDDRYILVFENENHYLTFGCDDFFFKGNDLIYYSLEDYLYGKAKIYFPALYCLVYDLKGIPIKEYHDNDRYQEDIRHICCIKEWKMNKYGTNRIQIGKKITDFYEVEFTLPDLVKYWGESE